MTVPANNGTENSIACSPLLKKGQGFAMLIYCPQFRANVSLFESGIHLVPALAWDFLIHLVVNLY